MALDGLGLVYEKQGNTGAAAYNQPVFEIGNNPLDRVAADIVQQGKMLSLQQQKEKEARDKANADALKIDVDAWDYDNKAFVGSAVEALMGEGARLKAMGKDINNLNDPDVKKFVFAKEKLRRVGEASKNQGKQLEGYLQQAAQNPDKYDYEQTAKRFKEYQAMNPVDRVDVDMANILVPKQKPLNMFQLVDEMPLDEFYNKNTYEDEKTRSSSTKARIKDIQDSITANANNPAYQAVYEDGLSKNLWTNKQEYIKVQMDEAKRRLKQESSFEKKAPKEGYTINTINGRSGDDLLNTIGYGEHMVKIPGTTGAKNVNYKYSTQLGNLDLVVANESLVDANTGKPIEKTGTQSIKSGVVALVPVFKGTNIPYPLSKGDDQKELVRSGKAEFKPMIFGKAVTGTGALAKETDVWAPVSATLRSTGDANKQLSEAEFAGYAYEKKAKEINEEYSKPVSKPTTTKAKKTNYTLNGKTYSISQIEKAANQSGVTVDEYIKSVGLK